MENGNFKFDLELQSFGGEEVFRGNLSKEDLSKTIKYGILLFQKYYESGRT